MSKIPAAQHEEQLAVFEQLALDKPMTTNQVRRLMEPHLGYLPGRNWTTARMREKGALLSRLEGLEVVRCPIHEIWMNAECAVCAGKITRCPHCGTYMIVGSKCTRHHKPKLVRPPRGLPPETIEAMRTDRRNGLTFGAIAEKHNVSRSHAFRIARRKEVK